MGRFTGAFLDTRTGVKKCTPYARSVQTGRAVRTSVFRHPYVRAVKTARAFTASACGPYVRVVRIGDAQPPRANAVPSQLALHISVPDVPVCSKNNAQLQPDRLTPDPPGLLDTDLLFHPLGVTAEGSHLN